MALKETGFGRLYAIDPHTTTKWNDVDSIDTHRNMRANLEVLGLTEVVTVVRKFSSEAISDVPKPFDLLFIDGDHSYDGVKSDWCQYTQHMSAFGIVVFHDTIWDL